VSHRTLQGAGTCSAGVNVLGVDERVDERGNGAVTCSTHVGVGPGICSTNLLGRGAWITSAAGICCSGVNIVGRVSGIAG
jgi:hypothetical protein